MDSRKTQVILFDENPIYWAIGIPSIVVLVYLGLFLHEWGHWLMAKLGGYRILGMSLGMGRLLRRYDTKHGIVEVRWAPIEGKVLAVVDHGRETRLHAFLKSAGGPLFTFLFLITLAILYYQLPASFLSDSHNTLVGQILSITLVLESFALAFTLLPWGHAPHLSDGAKMVQILRDSYPKENFYQESLREIRRYNTHTSAAIDEAIPENAIAREAMLHFLQCYHFEGNASGVERLDQTIQDEVLGPEERELLLSALADTALVTRQKDALTKAVPHVESFIEAHPEVELLRSRLGALHIETGDYLSGKLILRRLAKTSSSASIRAFALAYLGLCVFRQYGRGEAMNFLSEAQMLDPTCSALHRIKHEILGGSQSFLSN